MVTTQRLIVRPFREDDAQSFYELTQDEGFALFPITIYRQESVDSALEWIRKNALMFNDARLGKYAVVDKSSGELIGMGGLTPWTFENERLIDITYRLKKSAWGKGLGWELAQALLKFGLEELKLPEITATITPDNEPSIRIAERLGLTFDRKITLLGVGTELYRTSRTISSPTK